MPTIIENRIMYANHAVVLDPNLYADGEFAKPYLQEMAALLTPTGNAKAHKQELDRHNNDGSWTIVAFTLKAALQSLYPTSPIDDSAANYLRVGFVRPDDNTTLSLQLTKLAKAHGGAFDGYDEDGYPTFFIVKPFWF